MIDLDAIQADIDRYGGTNPEQGNALVAELRAARQQLEEYEHLRSTLVARFGLGSALRPSRVATQVIAAYDQLTEETTP